MDATCLPGIIEAVLFVCGEPVEISDLAHALDLTASEIEPILTALRDTYDLEKRGLRLARYGDSIQLTTRPDYAPFIEKLLQPVTKQTLTQTVMETLSIIAYKQPVTKSEIEAIRGVKSDYSIQLLNNRGLITEGGRRESLGRPILYITTETFLRHFNIETLEELPLVDIANAVLTQTEIPEMLEMDGESES